MVDAAAESERTLLMRLVSIVLGNLCMVMSRGGIMMRSCIGKKFAKLQGSTTAKSSDDSVNVTCVMHGAAFDPNIES